MVLEAFTLVFQPMCLLLILIGVIVGIIFGSIPGLSATMAVVLFLPMSFGMTPMNGISLLVGLYLGGISGGLISAILLKIPGTPSSISTVFDGGPMADKGEAGKALGVGILYSFIGGMISIFALMFISPYLAAVTLKFTPVEYFSIAIFSLTIIASLSGNSLINGLIAGLFGIALSMVGMAPIDALTRFTFGQYQLLSGFDIVVILIGVFAVTDIIKAGFDRKHLADKMSKTSYELKGFGISLKEFKEQFVNMIRSAVIGGSLIPLLTMGIPGNTVTAIFLGGLTIHGISPGPLIFQKSGKFVYGIFLALIVANIFMLIFERAGLRIFVKLLDIPKHLLLPIIMVCCVVGAYSSNSRIYDVWCVLGFGLLGILFKKLKIPTTPLIIGFILGSMAEENLRRALQASAGNWSVFVTRPISLAFLLIAAFSVLMTFRKQMKQKAAPVEEEE